MGGKPSSARAQEGPWCTKSQGEVWPEKGQIDAVSIADGYDGT